MKTQKERNDASERSRETLSGEAEAAEEDGWEKGFQGGKAWTIRIGMFFESVSSGPVGGPWGREVK